MKSIFNQLIFAGAMFFIIAAAQTKAQSVMTVQSTGNGEQVKIAIGGKSKTVKLEQDFSADFIAGGSAPHRYATLLAAKKGNSFFTIAKLQSGATLSGKNAPCGGDRPQTLLLIQAKKNLTIEKVQTEIFASCIYNGAGRYIQGEPQITKNKVSIFFDEGRKKYELRFDLNEADKGLQLIQL